MKLLLASVTPFTYSGSKTAVKFEATDESDNTTFKGTFWGHKLQGEVKPGTRIEVAENDAISWKEYKGENELSISFKAQVTILSHPGAATRPAAAPAGRQGATQAASGGSSGEDVMKRAATLTKAYYDELIGVGFDHNEALQICGGGGAASLYPLFWFGEKGMA